MEHCLVLWLAVLIALLSVGIHSVNADKFYEKLTQSDKLEMLKVHNDIRSKVASGSYTTPERGVLLPAASKMMRLEWDCELEEGAHEWANQCEFKHSGKGGENLFMVGDGEHQAETEGQGVKAVNYWLTELKLGGWEASKIVSSDSIGHAAQILSGPTIRVGCGLSRCEGGTKVFVVCRYKTLGNYPDTAIYSKGVTCSACPKTHHCQENLCTDAKTDETVVPECTYKSGHAASLGLVAYFLILHLYNIIFNSFV